MPRRRLILGAISIGVFLAALDAYVVVTLLPRMLADLAVPIDRIEQATPIISGFLVGYIVTLPLLGAVSDAHGRGVVYLGSLIVFCAGSAVTATAGLSSFPSDELAALPWLVFGRVLQGLGGGALVPVALAVAADVYPVGGRALAIGVVSAVQELGSLLGPLYGAAVAGVAAGFGSWRAVFWINLPLVAIIATTFVIARRAAVKDVRPAADDVAIGPPAASRVDWLGGLLLGAGLAALVLALYPDDPSQRAVGPLFLPLVGVAVVLLAMYLRLQLRATTPLIPATLLRDRVFVGGALTNVMVGVALIAALVDVPVVARAVFGLDQVGAALLLARFMVAVPVGAVAGGLLARRLGNRLTALVGLLAAAAGFWLMSGWPANELTRATTLGLPDATVTLVVCGAGFGLVIAPVAAAIVDRAAREAHGVAGSIVVLARTLGMLVGLSALAAFGIHRFHQLVAESSPALGLQARLTAAILREYHEVFTIASGVCLAGAAMALLSLPGRPGRGSAPYAS